jgi:Ca2+-binding EF-hand superfamily protein
VDVDGNGTLDLSEFLQFMNGHFCTWSPATDLGHVFRFLDRKGSGFVSKSAIRDLLLR